MPATFRGATAIELGKMMGATVIAAASTAEKLETCKRLGADHVINYDTEDLKVREKCFVTSAL
jgi:NADPH2:quinone reductase